jgi:hypothetical protein
MNESFLWVAMALALVASPAIATPYKLNPNALYQAPFTGAPTPDQIPTETQINAVQTTANSALAKASVGLPVSRRAPTASDDSTQGYAVGNLWNVPGLGLWQNIDATAGHAIWSRVPNNVLPYDAVAGANITSCYGTRKLRAGYTGYALQVTAPATYTYSGNTLQVAYSSTTTNIGFLADGSLDMRALAAAIGQPAAPTAGGVGPQTWSAFVTTWYDQCGSNNATTTASGGAAPSISPLVLNHGNPVIGFADGGSSWPTYNLDGSLAATMMHPRLTIPTTLSWSGTNVSIMADVQGGPAGNMLNTSATNDLIALQGTYPLEMQMAPGSSAGATPTAFSGGADISLGTVTPLNMYIPMTPSVWGFSNSSSALTAFDDDNFTFSGAPALGATGTGAIIGGVSSVNNGYQMGLDALFIGTAMTPAETATLRAAITDTFRDTPQVRDRLIWQGDSIGVGAEGWMGFEPIKQAMDMLTRPVVLFNLAIPGSTVGPVPEQSSPNAVSRLYTFAQEEGALYSPYGTCIYENEGGHNDLGLGATESQLYASMTQWVNNVRALGSNVKVIVDTLFPHPSITNDTLRQTYNAAILANYLNLDAIANSAGLAYMGNPADLSNYIYFHESGHHTPYGQSLEAGALAAAINSLLPQ